MEPKSKLTVGLESLADAAHKKSEVSNLFKQEGRSAYKAAWAKRDREENPEKIRKGLVKPMKKPNRRKVLRKIKVDVTRSLLKKTLTICRNGEKKIEKYYKRDTAYGWLITQKKPK